MAHRPRVVRAPVDGTGEPGAGVGVRADRGDGDAGVGGLLEDGPARLPGVGIGVVAPLHVVERAVLPGGFCSPGTAVTKPRMPWLPGGVPVPSVARLTGVVLGHGADRSPTGPASAARVGARSAWARSRSAPRPSTRRTATRRAPPRASVRPSGRPGAPALHRHAERRRGAGQDVGQRRLAVAGAHEIRGSPPAAPVTAGRPGRAGRWRRRGRERSRPAPVPGRGRRRSRRRSSRRAGPRRRRRPARCPAADRRPRPGRAGRPG